MSLLHFVTVFACVFVSYPHPHPHPFIIPIPISLSIRICIIILIHIMTSQPIFLSLFLSVMLSLSTSVSYIHIPTVNLRPFTSRCIMNVSMYRTSVWAFLFVRVAYVCIRICAVVSIFRAPVFPYPCICVSVLLCLRVYVCPCLHDRVSVFPCLHVSKSP